MLTPPQSSAPLNPGSLERVPEQRPVPWRIAFSVSWASLKRRIFRSLVTTSGVVLAIAFLTYMQVMNSITQGLVEANETVLNVLLQQAGVDIYSADTTDRMMILLITLSLLACLVGIMNSMLMSVTERIKEIGTLKCLGALDSFIVKTYLIESSLQGVVGTVFGLLVGAAVAVVVAAANYRIYVLHYFPYLGLVKALAISLVVGTLLSVGASILPAYMAARKEPVDAMRVEE